MVRPHRVSLYSLLTPVLTLTMFLWLVNPYACCPQDTTAAMQMAPMTTGGHVMSMAGNGSQMEMEQTSPSPAKFQNPLAKGTPKSLPDTTPCLTATVLARNCPDKLVGILMPTKDKPSSVIVSPLEYPPIV